jgi:hypothetical protein
MSLRAVMLVVALVGCAGESMKTDPNEPQTAREKQMREAKEKGELDAPSSKANAWTYAGDRRDCHYVVGRNCFKTKKVACTRACGSEKTCKVTGAGPAAVSCNRKK